jgi:hypothetical protein
MIVACSDVIVDMAVNYAAKKKGRALARPVNDREKQFCAFCAFCVDRP